MLAAERFAGAAPKGMVFGLYVSLAPGAYREGVFGSVAERVLAPCGPLVLSGKSRTSPTATRGVVACLEAKAWLAADLDAVSASSEAASLCPLGRGRPRVPSGALAKA